MNNSFLFYAKNSPDALATLDYNGRFRFANQTFNDLFMGGRKNGSSYRLNDLEIPSPLKSYLKKSIESACLKKEEEQFKCDAVIDGEQKHLICRVIPCSEAGEEKKILIELRDNSEAVKLKNELLAGRLTRRQEEYLKERRRRLFFGVLDDFATFVYMQRKDYTVAFANKKVRELYGEPEERLCYEVFAGRNEPCPVCPTFEVFDTGLPVEWEFTDNNGRTFLIYDYPFEDDTGEPLVMELGVDITDLKRVEKELFQAQKLRAIGVLAGGIAHDLNNNLVPIVFNIEYTLNKVKDREIHEPLAEALQAAHRAARLVEQVLEYSRQQDVSRTSIHLVPLVRESAKDFRNSLPETIIFKTDLNIRHDSVSANPAQIQQVVLNLLRNAEQSMPGGGTISVTLAEEEIPARKEKMHRELAPGRYVTLSVSDTGIGIRPEIMERIFEPFFTSRKASGGTGMGLAVVHSVVTGSGGTIMAESDLGIGTSFTVFLPQVAPSTDRLEGELCFLHGENIIVLLVDDDPGSLSAMARSLRQAGFEVDTSNSGEEGLKAFARDPERYSLILADQSMPGMTGLQMSKQILKINTDARIVICTGHIEPALEEQVGNEGISGFARKPMSPKSLIEMVKRHCRYA